MIQVCHAAEVWAGRLSEIRIVRLRRISFRDDAALACSAGARAERRRKSFIENGSRRPNLCSFFKRRRSERDLAVFSPGASARAVHRSPSTGTRKPTLFPRLRYDLSGTDRRLGRLCASYGNDAGDVDHLARRKRRALPGLTASEAFDLLIRPPHALRSSLFKRGAEHHPSRQATPRF